MEARSVAQPVSAAVRAAAHALPWGLPHRQHIPATGKAPNSFGRPSLLLGPNRLFRLRKSPTLTLTSSLPRPRKAVPRLFCSSSGRGKVERFERSKRRACVWGAGQPARAARLAAGPALELGAGRLLHHGHRNPHEHLLPLLLRPSHNSFIHTLPGAGQAE